MPESIRTAIRQAGFNDAEELRMRLGCRPALLRCGAEVPLGCAAVTERMIEAVLEKASGASLHCVMPEIREGYMCFSGLRLGLCGTAVYENEKMTGLRCFSSLAVRIPHEFPGLLDEVMQPLCTPCFESTVILGAPGAGKTTALREAVRYLSSSGFRTAIADERNEIAAKQESRPGYELGDKCDVMTGVAKREAVMMLLRGMNPDVIVMDEITRPEDAEAVLETAGCAVPVLASAHAASVDDLYRRAVYKKLMQAGVFVNAIIISNTDGNRKYKAVRL